MKAYTSRATKFLAVLSTISILLLILGIILILIDVPNTDVQLILALFGGVFTTLFLPCYFAEKSRKLIIDTDKVIFSRGANKEGNFVFQKTVIPFNEIDSIEHWIFRGDGFFTLDTYCYTLYLKDKTAITITLSSYDKKTVEEVCAIIRERIH